MAGLEVSKVQSNQGTTASRKQQATQQNIVIEFSSLPENMKTKSVRDFYDKDGSGFLESKNADGINEVALMQKAFGLDLSKYKSNITKVVKTVANHEGRREMSRAYDKQGNWIKDLEIYDDGKVGTFETTKNQFKFSKLYNAKDYSLALEATIDPKTGCAKDAIHYLKNGMKCIKTYTKKGSETVLTDKNGKILATATYQKGKDIANVLKDESLTTGKNKLVATKTYSGTETYDNGVDLLFGEIPENIPEDFKLTNTEYTLNGKAVQAKSIGKGRYEVIDEKGNVFYISHDGVNLKPEYVRSNP